MIRVPRSRRLAVPALVLLLLAVAAGCATQKPLPVYEPPLPRAEVQHVRTTAYTHTEADHLAYGARNALGGRLRVAEVPRVAVALPVSAPSVGGFQRPVGRGSVTVAAVEVAPVTYGSAAADWSRWPAGTEFRILSTGELYRVDDYGWALAGRNTIDLYKPTRASMNAWAVRHEDLQILRWGDPEESLRRLRRHQEYRHIRRMVLELEGKRGAAARLR